MNPIIEKYKKIVKKHEKSIDYFISSKTYDALNSLKEEAKALPEKQKIFVVDNINKALEEIDQIYDTIINL